jgi:serine/threonine-protein kinase
LDRILPDLLTEADFPVTFGKYTLLGILGEGGMARVFKAEMQGMEGFRKRAAVKIVRSALAANNDQLRTALINEARLGGLLHHPNIVDTYDYGEVDGLPYIAMEYVRGVGLEEVLRAADPIPAPVAFEIAIQMCAGLDHAHNLEEIEGDSELIHRDLKPSNVLLSRDGLVKVMDFGIAKASAVSASNTATGMTKGTPSYMSPEQVNGETLDRRSDLFAVGAILYELFTGKRLFSADSLMSILMAVMQVEERLEASGALDELDLSALGLSDIVRKCLRRHAVDRYCDAAEVEQELKLLARSIDPPPPLKQWVRGLMDQGLGNMVGESSVHTAPPHRASGAPSRTARTPMDSGLAAAPRSDAAAAPVPRAQVRTLPPPPSGSAPQAVGPTRIQTELPPPGPPATDPRQTVGGAPSGTLWMEDEEPRKRASPILLILLGLLLGGGLALMAAVGAMVLLGTPGSKYASNDPGTDAPAAAASAEAAWADLDLGDAVADAGDAAPAPRPRGSARKGPASDEPPLADVSEPESDRESEGMAPEPELTDQEDHVDEIARVVEEPTPPRAEPPRDTSAGREAAPPPQVAPRATTTPPPTPARLSGVDARILGREGGVVEVRFQAALEGTCPSPRVRVHFNPPGARWVKKSMELVDGVWRVDLDFPKKNQGSVFWYVTGRCEGVQKVYHGSQDSHRKLRVR